eukprot:TRINITY_DN27667_c0_g1_i1.p1 TRINITY_DN27667_c0_g1~~TRINITY_DN27667_c0_g1_i1.p1  ORF type:complete len:240 (+),score=35.87 TRINITY_DN27667_c0_g1_i1:87-806(+)
MSCKLVFCATVLAIVVVLFWSDVIKRNPDQWGSGLWDAESISHNTTSPTHNDLNTEHPCKTVPGYHYNGRLINKKTDNTSEGCRDKCLNDQGCGYFTYNPSNKGCFIYAYIDEQVRDNNSQSGDCIHKCQAISNTSTDSQVDKPTECTLEDSVWYEGGGPKGGYASQLDIRLPSQSAACSAKARSPGVCARQCLSIPECVSFNWRQRDNACHKFSSRGPRHDGKGNVGGIGHTAGNCTR